MRHQEILFNVAGQTFYIDPPEGRASGTPTVQVFSADVDDDGTVEAATTGAASVDSVNTTLSAAASRLASTVTVASATGITAGRRYLLGDEWVEVRSISSTTLTLRRPLQGDHASGAAFVGCRISIAVDSAWMADENNITEWTAGFAGYRLRWAYTVDSVPRLGVSYADLVRYSYKHLVTALDVEAAAPGWIDRLPPDYQTDQGAALIDEAAQAVRMDALGDEVVARRIRNSEVLRELIIRRAIWAATEHMALAGAQNEAAQKAAKDAYDRRYVQLLREPKVPIDEAGGGAGAVADRLPLWRR